MSDGYFLLGSVLTVAAVLALAWLLVDEARR